MAFDKVIDSALLDAGMTATANAIRKKTGNNSPIEWDSSNGFKAAVEVIDTDGGVELPELDTPASDDDVFLGKEYIDGSGQKQSGSFTIEDELTEQDDLISRIANALKGKAAGSLPSLPEIELPELSNPGTAGDLAEGKQLIDASGNVVNGTLVEDNLLQISDNVRVETDDGTIEMVAPVTKDHILRAGAYSRLIANSSAFGNASPSDVVEGKTFTSAAGLKVPGTVKEVSTVYTTPHSKATMEWDDDWKASNVLEEDVLLRKGTTVNTWFNRFFFGDAKPEDVRKGKFFSSGYALNQEGTMEVESGAELPKLENPAYPDDIVSGKTLYDDGGNPVTGTMKTVESEELEPIDDGSGNVKFSHMATYNRYVPAWNLLTITSPLYKFGDASPNDVQKGKTFTSTSGVRVEGTMEPNSGPDLPELDNPGTAGDLAKGKQLIGADGKLVTGTIEDGFMWHYHYDGSVSAYEEDGAICFDHAFDKDVLYRKGEHIILCHSDLGDALPQEVVKGRTFTTSKGVKIEGTMEPGSGGVQMHVDGETLVITGAVTIENETLIL